MCYYFEYGLRLWKQYLNYLLVYPLLPHKSCSPLLLDWSYQKCGFLGCNLLIRPRSLQPRAQLYQTYHSVVVRQWPGPRDTRAHYVAQSPAAPLLLYYWQLHFPRARGNPVPCPRGFLNEHGNPTRLVWAWPAMQYWPVWSIRYNHYVKGEKNR